MVNMISTSPDSPGAVASADDRSSATTSQQVPYQTRWITLDLRTLATVVAMLALALVVMRQVRTYGSGSDFWFLWNAAGQVHRGVNPYLHQVRWLEGYRGGPYEDIFLIPAWLMWFIGPLTILPFKLAWALWSVGNIVALLASAGMALRAGGWRVRPLTVALIALALGMTRMAGVELYYGNVDFLVLVCLCGSVLAGSRGRRATEGVLVGIACGLSVQVWALPLFFLWKRNYRALAYTLGTWALLGVASCLWFPNAVRTYAEMLRFAAYQWAPFYINQSVYALLLRLFTPTPYATPPLISPLLALLLWGLFCAALLAVGARFVSRRAAEAQAPGTYALEFGVSLCLALALTPFLESNNLAPMLLVLLAVLAAATVQRRRQMAARSSLSMPVIAMADLASVTLLLAYVPMNAVLELLANAHHLSGFAALAPILAASPYSYLLCATIVVGALALRHQDMMARVLSAPGNVQPNLDRSATPPQPILHVHLLGSEQGTVSAASQRGAALPVYRFFAGSTFMTSGLNGSHPADAELAPRPDVARPVPSAHFFGISNESLAANARSFYPRAYLASALARFAPYDMLNRRRAAMYRALGFRGIARDVLILGPLRLLGRGNIYEFLTIGEGSAIATPCALSLYAPLTIGRRVHFGPDVMVLTGTHEIGPAEERCGPYRFAPVTIGDGTWVGARAVIHPGVTIGAGCVISAGAVVTRDMPPSMLVAGNPARAVQRLDASMPTAAEAGQNGTTIAPDAAALAKVPADG